MIEIRQINVTFNKKTLLANTVLKNVTLQINQGEFITIIGGNGAGKSTLMNVIAGETKIDSGKIFIDGVDYTNFTVEQRAKNIARVFQDPMIGTCADLTIEENLSLASMRNKMNYFAFSINNKMRTNFCEKLAFLNMGLEHRLKDKVSGLSGGQRQILSLVMATLTPSKILLLDEHTAALDPKMAKIVLNLTNQIVKSHNLTALMITHSMTQALEYGTRTIMMYHGEIIKDMQNNERKLLDPAQLLSFFDL